MRKIFLLSLFTLLLFGCEYNAQKTTRIDPRVQAVSGEQNQYKKEFEIFCLDVDQYEVEYNSHLSSMNNYVNGLKPDEIPISYELWCKLNESSDMMSFAKAKNDYTGKLPPDDIEKIVELSKEKQRLESWRSQLLDQSVALEEKRKNIREHAFTVLSQIESESNQPSTYVQQSINIPTPIYTPPPTVIYQTGNNNSTYWQEQRAQQEYFKANTPKTIPIR